MLSIHSTKRRYYISISVLFAPLALCCTAESPTTAVLTHQFSFVVVADPHIASAPEHLQRLQGAVEWINAAAIDEKIEVVMVVGDIGWSGGLPRAQQALDALTMPYVPIIGDNEVHIGAEERFDEVFGAHLDSLPFSDVSRGTVEV
ncbi:MAG: hypothetical protein ACI9MC_002580, partial [Kiritimatiellia bacterium]